MGSAGNKAKVLEAFARWLNLSHCGGLPEAELAKHPLTDAAIAGLKAEDTFDSAVEAIVNIIYATSEGGRPGQASLNLISKIVPAVPPPLLLPSNPAHTPIPTPNKTLEGEGFTGLDLLFCR